MGGWGLSEYGAKEAKKEKDLGAWSFSLVCFAPQDESGVRLSAAVFEKERPHVVWPMRMSSGEEKWVERTNGVLFGFHETFR